MQKKLIALAVAGLASTAAFAQTNVVVYGVADGTFDYVWQSGSKAASTTVNTTTNAAGVITAQTTNFSTQDNDVDFTRVSANSSYLGFKGSEDLGNGLKAIFQYENSVNFDSTGGTWAARDSFVGLSHAKGGTVVLGNLTGPTRALGAALDVNPGATGIGANSGVIGKIAGLTLRTPPLAVTRVTNPAGTVTVETANGNLSANCGRSSICTSIFDTRWANAIAYLSPNWGGFSFAAAYVANENKSADFGTTTTTTTNNLTGVSTVTATPAGANFSQLDTYGYDLGIKWEGMGFMAAVTYNWAQFGDWADTEVDNLRVGGMYTAPNWSIRAMWEKTSADLNNNLLGLSNTDQQKFGIGGTFSFGKSTLLAQWYGTNSAKSINDSKANLFEVGYLYNLSKRTMLKATWAMIDNDDGSVADFGVNAIGNQSSGYNANRTTVAGVGTTTSETFGSSGAGARNQGIQVGVRHSF
jgi:predicted porin